jgi:hypothetical protein
MHRHSEHASQATSDVHHPDNLEQPQQRNISLNIRPGTDFLSAHLSGDAL